MRIGILGTGMVGRALVEGFARTGHDVVMGTRDAPGTVRRELSGPGQPTGTMSDWLAAVGVDLVDLRTAASHGEVVVNATIGGGSIACLGDAGSSNLACSTARGRECQSDAASANVPIKLATTCHTR